MTWAWPTVGDDGLWSRVGRGRRGGGFEGEFHEGVALGGNVWKGGERESEMLVGRAGKTEKEVGGFAGTLLLRYSL